MLDVFIQFALGFIIALTGALIPGPLLTFVISHTLTYGKIWSGLLAGLGHCIVEAFIITSLILGLTNLFNFSLFQLVVNIIGGIALIVFGILNILTSRRWQIRNSEPKMYANSLVGGIFFTIFNATIPLWWATTGFFMLNRALMTTTMLGVAFWILGHWSADLAWFGFVGYSISKGRNYIGERVHSLIILLCGTILISLGIFFLASSSINLR